MNNPLISTPLAEIPLFDMKGGEFLIFYGIVFAIALVWSLLRRTKALDQFEVPSNPDSRITDPYEIGFLSGGVARCSQLAIVRLMDAGAVEWKRGAFTGSRLLTKGSLPPTANDIERKLYTSIFGYGTKGMPLTAVVSQVTPHLHGIEAKLARQGLRPTQSERSGIGFRAVLPLVLLIVLGIVKLMVGIARDKPVIFLAILLFVTVLVAVAVASNIKRLTPGGEEMLGGLRSGYQPVRADGASDLYAMSLGVALMGPSIFSGRDGFAEMDAAMKKDLNQMGGPTSSGSGCSTSGCGGGGGDSGGGGGCGGGGCGGCGGGGD